MISAAHASSSACAVGRHEKIFRRLGVSDTPVTSIGPCTMKSRRCGSMVMPQRMLTSASVFSSGISRSSTGPSSFCTNAADTRCGPALMCTGGVTQLEAVLGIGLAHARVEIEHRHALAVRPRPRPVPSGHRRSWCCGRPARRAARSAATPSGGSAPSAGNMCTTEMPPRVPIGRAVDAAHLRRGARNLVGGRGGRGVAIAHREAADLAGRAQVAVHQGRREASATSATLSKPWLIVSGGRYVETSTSTLSRSRTAFAYSARFRRWNGREPGFGLSAACTIHPRFERRQQARQHGRLRTTGAGGRHHAGAELADHLFGELAVLLELGRIERLQATSARPCCDRCGRSTQYLLDERGLLGRRSIGRHRRRCRRGGREWPAGLAGAAGAFTSGEGGRNR